MSDLPTRSTATRCPRTSTSPRTSVRTRSPTSAAAGSRRGCTSGSRPVSLLGWFVSGNGGLLAAAILVGLIGVYSFAAGWHLAVDQTEALAVASRTVGFPVGHASAQLAWRGLLSRPAWRMLLYSADEPPSLRGLVELDAVDGHVMGEYTERNPEDWSGYGLTTTEGAGTDDGRRST